MGNSPTPPGLLERILLEVDRRIASFARSGFLRNATITDGGLTIKGGFLKLLSGLVNLFYVGPLAPNLPGGTPQQGMVLRREDGTLAMALYDPDPSVDFKQFLALYDRSGNIIFSDDTDSGQGMARPNLPFTAYVSRSADWPTVNSGTFETVYKAVGLKHQPRLRVETWAYAPDAGAVAEVQILVNGSVWGTAQPSVAGFVTGLNFGPLAVSGGQRSTLTIELQYRLASGTGVVRCGPGRIEGWQS